MSVFQKLVLIFKDRQLRNKILFVLGILAVFRLAANIPLPGVNLENLKTFFEQNQFFGLLNMFVGGTMSRFSIVLLGVGPYITSIIIIQLLTMIFPQLERLYKEEGEAGRQKVNQYGRIIAVPLAAMQGYAMIALLQRPPNPVINPPLAGFALFSAILTIVAGTIFLMWLGELISEKGIGNGVSILIFAGIISRVPFELFNVKNVISSNPGAWTAYLFFFVAAVVILAGVVLITEARRNIPVSYAKRVRGNRMYGGVSTYLPININPAGVIPIIFALSILLFPSMVANFLAGSGGGQGGMAGLAQNVAGFLQNPWVHGLFFFGLVFLFTYFYTAVTFDPESIANNLQKMGGFVPGIRPGQSTAQFLHKILYRILFLGASFLGFIAVMPSIVQGLTDALFSARVEQLQFLVGGTALLIVVSVVLDTWRQIKSQLEMREYDTY